MPSSILIVDDESGIRQSLSALLRDEGYDVSAVSSGEECVEAAARRAFDLILLDIWLPGMDGLATLERLNERNDAPMVVMISGHAKIETAVRATKLGAFDFIEKPLSIICALKKKIAACAPNSNIVIRFLATACR